MPGLKIYTSNRLEILSERLADTVRSPISSNPFSPEIIILQSRGMERWLSMELAKRNGICANCRFLFPNAFLDDILKRFFPDIPAPGDSLFEPGVMAFSIFKILPDLVDEPGFESLKKYLADDTNKLKLFQLSEKIADLFDQYVVFRPDMIFMWENSLEDKKGPHAWQAGLWREITGGKENYHRAGLQKALINKILTLSLQSDRIYERVSIFGISSLPPFHMQVIEALSRITEVNMFMLSPCREYWFDALNEAEAARIKTKYAGQITDEKDLHIETGNRLLSSMGELGRTFFRYIISSDHELIEEYQEQEYRNLLSCIQSDILCMRDRKMSDAPCAFQPCDTDGSLQFHSCHSPMREVEVLYDNLLAVFEDNPDMIPNDILVMSPDIEIYAPFIHAVFGASGGDRLRIPYSVSDRSIRKESGVADGFLAILDLNESRFKANEIISVLEYPGVKEKFGLNETDLEKIRGWIRDTRVRWGFDGTYKTALGLPGFCENTWKAGIERMLLGYAMPEKDGEMFSGILPFSGIEGADAKILGNFIEFIEKIRSCSEMLVKKHTIKSWYAFLTWIVDAFFTGDDSQNEIQFIRQILNGMLAKAELSGFDKEMEIDAVKYYVKKAIEKESSYSGFMTGGVTFCSMLPMRSIPFEVICLLGMNNDAFPRSSYSYGFDLMADDPRPGDRSRKNDDKYLFLEALISARKIFYVSYVGQGIQDNSPIPPCVLVSELLDYIRKGFGLESSRMITSHKLQAFSPEYFRDKENLFSYSEENMLAACSLFERRDKDDKNNQFISKGLLSPPEEFRRLSIESLCNFYVNPARYILRKRLGIYLEEKESDPDDRENFDLTGLDNYFVDQDLVEDIEAGKSTENIIKTYKAGGVLPHGKIGEILLKESAIRAEKFVNKIEERKEGSIALSLDIEMTVDNFFLTGRLDNIYETGMINFRYAALKAKDILRTWIRHLFLCRERPSKTVLICRDKIILFKPVEKSNEYIAGLLNLYWEGLVIPIHFFPDLSLEYAEYVYFGKKEKTGAVKAIKNKWDDSGHKMGVAEDPYYNLCYRNADTDCIFDDSFIKSSESVFFPILDHLHVS